MTNTQKEKFASQADPQVLEALRTLAKAEGRQFQAVLDEAMRDYIERKRSGKTRRHVMDAFEKSLAKYDALYRDLAK